MIFALIDYLAYVRRSGRYSRNFKNSVMSGAFQGKDHVKKIVSLLRPGDILLVQTLDSLSAWLVMYLTTSEISHVASYIGNGQIIHATSKGVSIDSLESLFDQNTRVLPAQLNIPDAKREEVIGILKSKLGRPYGWRSVITKGIFILSARDWPYFRWFFAADIALLLLVFDLPRLMFLHRPLFTWIIPVYMILISFHWALWKILPVKFSEWSVKPCDILSIIQQSEGTLVFDAYQLAQLQKGSSANDDQPL